MPPTGPTGPSTLPVQTDSCQDFAKGNEAQVKGPGSRGATVVVQAPEGATTLKVAYFFSGVERKGSVANCLAKLCAACGSGLVVEEVDIMVGGNCHNLLDRAAQDEWIARIESGEFDFVLFSPPCGTWSRANWANSLGPAPCRDRAHPWGIPRQLFAQRRRASQGRWRTLGTSSLFVMPKNTIG